MTEPTTCPECGSTDLAMVTEYPCGGGRWECGRGDMVYVVDGVLSSVPRKTIKAARAAESMVRDAFDQ
jgi:ribosomal protein S27AE